MPSIEGGGVEKNLFIVSNYLAKKLGKISLISASLKYKNKFNKNVDFVGPKSRNWDSKSRRAKYFICLFLLFKKILINKNVLVFAFQANIYCLIVCKLLNTKIVVRSNSAPIGWSNNFFKLFIFKRILKLADITMVNSLKFKKELKKKFNVDSKVIYNPLNTKEIIKLSRKKLKESFFKKKSLNIINVARFTDQKDHLTLLKAINKIKYILKVKLLIIGYGSNEKLIKKYIKENNLKKIVKVINYQDNPYPYLKLSDCMILTSLFEGLPNVLLEGLTLKKFIISTDCPTGPNEILMNGKYGFLFKIGDYNQLSSLILKYSKNKKLFYKKTILGFKSLNRFDYMNNCKKYLKVILESL